jgi:hypothetical protein
MKCMKVFCSVNLTQLNGDKKMKFISLSSFTIYIIKKYVSLSKYLSILV